MEEGEAMGDGRWAMGDRVGRLDRARLGRAELGCGRSRLSNWEGCQPITNSPRQTNTISSAAFHRNLELCHRTHLNSLVAIDGSPWWARRRTRRARRQARRVHTSTARPPRLCGHHRRVKSRNRCLVPGTSRARARSTQLWLWWLSPTKLASPSSARRRDSELTRLPPHAPFCLVDAFVLLASRAA